MVDAVVLWSPWLMRQQYALLGMAKPGSEERRHVLLKASSTRVSCTFCSFGAHRQCGELVLIRFHPAGYEVITDGL